jgi:hypothetical protein
VRNQVKILQTPEGGVIETFNPESALGFVMKLDYSIKIGAHGLFLKKEDFCLLILKMGVSV